MKRILILTGWARTGLMLGCGALAALSLAPLLLWPLVFPAYGLWLHYLLRAESAKAAFRLSWWWGLGFFVVGLYWVCISMTVDLPRFGWMIPLALIGLNGALALFPALSGWVFFRLPFRHDIINWVMFSLLVFVSEWLRGHLFTGFPWNLIGTVWGASDASIQAAALLSVYPLTFVTILLASSAALWRLRWPPLLSLAVILGLVSYGIWRMGHATCFEPLQSLRLVQGNIAQQVKWDPAHQLEALRTHIALSQDSDARLIIWSESAFPFTLRADEPLPPEPFKWLKAGQVLITGAVMVSAQGGYTNSMIAVDHRAQLVARYDKQHLVPFGEYVPFGDLLPIQKLTAGMADFTAGKGPRRFAVAGKVMTPLVCYEVIFPSYAAEEKDSEFMLNLTNDDWFGYSSGPFQHLMAARFRAVEQNKPLIRLANSGISAVIDRYGRVQQSLPLHERGIIDVGGDAVIRTEP